MTYCIDDTNFYPRPPWGGRHTGCDTAQRTDGFLSTPSVGRATTAKTTPKTKTKFLSTPSVGRATTPPTDRIQYRIISIHALRGEGDDIAQTVGDDISEFLSTPSAGRATLPFGLSFECRKISIHALSGEGDDGVPRKGAWTLYFYPRPPWGGRLVTRVRDLAGTKFLSTPSVGRATKCSGLGCSRC